MKPITLRQNSSVRIKIPIIRDSGFAEKIIYTVEGLPKGVTATFKPTSSIGDMITETELTLTAALDAPKGGFTCVVSGEPRPPRNKGKITAYVPDMEYGGGAAGGSGVAIEIIEALIVDYWEIGTETSEGFTYTITDPVAVTWEWGTPVLVSGGSGGGGTGGLPTTSAPYTGERVAEMYSLFIPDSYLNSSSGQLSAGTYSVSMNVNTASSDIVKFPLSASGWVYFVFGDTDSGYQMVMDSTTKTDLRFTDGFSVQRPQVSTLNVSSNVERLSREQVVSAIENSFSFNASKAEQRDTVNDFYDLISKCDSKFYQSKMYGRFRIDSENTVNLPQGLSNTSAARGNLATSVGGVVVNLEMRINLGGV